MSPTLYLLYLVAAFITGMVLGIGITLRFAERLTNGHE